MPLNLLVQGTMTSVYNKAINDAIDTCKDEKVSSTDDPTDESYNRAIDDCIHAIKKLLEEQ